MTREELEAIVADISGAIRDAVNEHAGGPGRVGFCLLLFDFGAGGNLAYAANARREDMIKTIDEFRHKLLVGVGGRS